MRLKVTEATAIPFAGALALSIEIAIRNFPAGAVMFALGSTIMTALDAAPG